MRKSKPWLKRLLILPALSALTFSTGCATSDLDRLTQARVTQAQAADIERLIAEARHVPDFPADCRREERSGVKAGDRLDVALLKADHTIGRGNARIRRCAAWYDALQSMRNK